MNKVLLLAIVLVGVSCGDQGSAGPEAGYTLADIVARPAELDGREVAVSASVSDVARPYAFRLATGDGTSVLVLGGDAKVVEGSSVRVTGVVAESLGQAQVPDDIAGFARSLQDDYQGPVIVADTVKRLDRAGEF